MSSAVDLLRQTSRQPIRMCLLAIGAFTLLALVGLLLPVGVTKYLVMIGAVIGLVGSLLALGLISLSRMVGLEKRADRVMHEGASNAIIPVKPLARKGAVNRPAAGVHPRKPSTAKAPGTPAAAQRTQPAAPAAPVGPVVDVRATSGVDLRETQVPAKRATDGRLKISD